MGGWVVVVGGGQVLCVLMKSCYFNGFFFNLSTSLTLDSKTFLVVWQHGTPVRLRGGRPAYPKRWPGSGQVMTSSLSVSATPDLSQDRDLAPPSSVPGGPTGPLPVIRTCLLQLPCLSWQGVRTLLGFFLCPCLPRNRMMSFCSALDAPSKTLLRWFCNLPLRCLLRTLWCFLQPFFDHSRPTRNRSKPQRDPFLHHACTGLFLDASTCLLCRLGLVMARTGLSRSGPQHASVSDCSSSSRCWSCFGCLPQLSGQAAYSSSSAADDWFDRSDTIAFPPCAQPDLTSGKDSVIQGTGACQRRSVSRSHFSSSVSAIWLVFTHWVIKMWYTPHKYMMIGSHTHVLCNLVQKVFMYSLLLIPVWHG